MNWTYLLAPGLGDAPCEKLDGKTPLEIAKGRFFAEAGALARFGSVQIPAAIVSAESLWETLIPDALGYSADKFALARGILLRYCLSALPAVSAGDEKIYWSCRPLTLDENGKIHESRVVLSQREASAFVAELNGRFAGSGFQWIGESVGDFVLVSDDPSLREHWTALRRMPSPDSLKGSDPLKSLPKNAAGDKIKKLLTAVHEFLETSELNKVRVDLGENPVTGLWFWGAAQAVDLPPFNNRVKGTVRALTDDSAFVGLCRMAGIPAQVASKPVREPGDLKEFFDEAESLREQTDGLILCLTAPFKDSIAGDLARKVRWIEALDFQLADTFADRVASGGERLLIHTLALCATEKRSLLDAPAPVLLAGVKGGSEARRWSEAACAKENWKPESGAAFIEQSLEPRS